MPTVLLQQPSLVFQPDDRVPSFFAGPEQIDRSEPRLRGLGGKPPGSKAEHGKPPRRDVRALARRPTPETPPADRSGGASDERHESAAPG